MADRYIFDKRDMKKKFVRYGVLFFIAFLVLIPLNLFLLVPYLTRGMGIFISILVALAIILLGNYLIYLYQNRRNKK